jgi:hypothetical protein
VGSPSLAAEAVDLQLVLSADVSRSIDEQRFQLQRQGYATALLDPRVLGAIRSGHHGKIAVCFLEWSGEAEFKLIADWTVVGDDESAAILASAIVAAPRPFAGRTSISVGIDVAVAQLRRADTASERQIIDVSGDGTNNSGRPVDLARDEAVAAGITINGLAIISDVPSPFNPMHTHPPGGLDEYYRQHVVGGPGAFVMVTKEFTDFAYAITNKLIREISGEPAPLDVAAAR